MHRLWALLAVLSLALVGCGPDWDAITTRIRDARPEIVRGVHYDAEDDFLTVTVAEDATIADALSLSCDTIRPILDKAGSIALHAVYTESGRILTSWNRCPPA